MLTMAPKKRQDPTVGRRRIDDEEGEDDSVPFEDDESSVATITSDAEHEADADEEASDLESSPASRRKTSKRANGKPMDDGGTIDSTLQGPDFNTVSADTMAMMNGLQLNDQADDAQAIHFGDDLELSAVPTGPQETIAEKRKREHEEYKKKRDADPAFVPNRGGFFMHDSRSAPTGPASFRGGRGRGRGGRGGLQFG